MLLIAVQASQHRRRALLMMFAVTATRLLMPPFATLRLLSLLSTLRRRCLMRDCRHDAAAIRLCSLLC